MEGKNRARREAYMPVCVQQQYLCNLDVHYSYVISVDCLLV